MLKRFLFFILLGLTFTLTAGRQQSAAAMPQLFAVQFDRTVEQNQITPTLHRTGEKAVVTLDYGSFTWMVVTEQQLAALDAADIQAVGEREPYALTLGGETFDPLFDEPKVLAGWEPLESAGGPDFHLVQLIGPTKSAWLNALENTGLQIVQYIHPYTYVVWGSAESLAELPTAQNGRFSESQFVRWTGAFQPMYRAYLARDAAQSEEMILAQALVYTGADGAAILRSFKLAGVSVVGQAPLNNIWTAVNLSLSGEKMPLVAAIPGVYTIQPVAFDGGLRGELSNLININSTSSPGYQNWLAAAGVSGAGVIIANVDGGVSTTHLDLVNRMVNCTGPTCSGTAVDINHGTHTAGIMAADGASGTKDSGNFLRGLGMAPGANLIRQFYYPNYFSLPNGMLQLMTDSYRSGASVSGNSWGPSGSPLGYDANTMQVDIGTRDADPEAGGNQPLLYVLSIMNGWGGTSTQGTPDDAKNIFTVGSTYAQYNTTGLLHPNINNISPNSAHGPARDGRLIPHMVAPGWYVDSTISGNSYRTYGGTSMASPHVTGSAALFIEKYLGQTGIDPSPALVKAAFLAAAKGLAGFIDANGGVLGHPFDARQGWGRLDTAVVISPTVPVLYFDAPTLFLQTGETWEINLTPAIPGQPVRLMLVWTDAPGHGLGGATPAWNNNLDLVVELNGNTYRGNAFGPDGWSVINGAADGKNNTEGVFLGPAVYSTFDVTVLASALTSDGVPGVGSATDQDFALVCYNCASANPSGFELSAAPEHLEICATETAQYTVSLSSIPGLEARPVNLSLEESSAVASASFSPNPVTPDGTSQLSITPAAGPDELNLPLTITGEDGNMVVTDTVLISIYQSIPTPVQPISPTATQLAPIQPLFTWIGGANATQFTLQIATDQGFNNLIYMVSTHNTNHQLLFALEQGRVYYWRVLSSNVCGESHNPETVRIFTESEHNEAPFYIVPEPQEQVVCLPDPAYYMVEVKTNSGTYDLPVSLNIGTLPGNFTALFSNNPVVPDGETMLTIQPGSPMGQIHYTFTITGSDGLLTTTTDLGLSVYDGVPGAAELGDPSNLPRVPVQPVFSWSSVPDAITYTIQIGESPTFNPLVFQAETRDTFLELPFQLTSGATHYWRVISRNVCAGSTISAMSQIEVEILDTDQDGVGDEVEDGAPNNGDGNYDGIPDKLQPHVASLPGRYGDDYITLVVPQPARFDRVQAVQKPSSPEPTGISFAEGFISYEISGFAPGTTVPIAITLHSGRHAHQWWIIGPAPGVPFIYLRAFQYNGKVGAQVGHTQIVVYLKDGAYGDNDVTTNGRISGLGAPAFFLNQIWIPYLSKP